MNGFIALTDHGWYQQLMASQPDEVNFWKPVGSREFKALKPGEPFFFKLKAAHGRRICGFGLYVGFVALGVRDAWEQFGRKNGVESLDEMRARISHYVRRNRGEEPPPDHRIGCIILTSPRFFPEPFQVAPPADWSPNIVTGSGYDLEVGEGKRIWADCLERAQQLNAVDTDLAYNLALLEEGVEFRERLARVRLGQGGFRAVVTKAYDGTCAVSGDHTLPVLEAAHVRSVAEGGTHELSNGLLLRADIHRLYDRHLVSVSPDYEFLVSPRLRDEYQNGAAYYALEGRQLQLPKDKTAWPKREYLESHRDRFAG